MTSSPAGTSTKRWTLAAALAFGLLTGCASGPPPPCPNAVVAGDVAQLTRFREGGQDLTDVLFEIRMLRTAVACEYDDNAVEATVRVLFGATRGPADEQRRAYFRYFVAITDQDRNILVREEFDLQAEFPGNRTQVEFFDDVEPRIPLAEGKAGPDYVIFVGLIVTREELEYNRRTLR